VLDQLQLVKKESIEVERKEIEVILDDESLRPIKLSFPAVDDIESIRKSFFSKISVHEIAEDIDIWDVRTLRSELEKYYSKYDQYKDSPTFLIQLASLHQMLHENEKAEEILWDAHRRFDREHLRHALCDELVMSNKITEAEALYSEVTEDSGEAHTLLRKAYFAINAHETDVAERLIARADLIDPFDYNTLVFKGGIELYKGECDKAVRNFRLAVQEKPTSSNAFVNLATAYWCKSQTAQALKALKTAIEINPLNQNAIIFYSDLVYTTGEAPKAIPSLSLFTKYNQKSENIWERLARAYYIAEEYGRAGEALRHQASIKETPAVWNNLGLVHWRLKDRKKGIKFIVHAIDMAGTRPKEIETPLMNLISLLLEMNDHRTVLKISKDLITEKQLPESILERVYLKYVIALESLHKHAVATAEAQNFLSAGIKNTEVKLSLLLHLVYYKTVLEKDKAAALKSIEMSIAEAKAHPDISMELWSRVFNNCMFSLLCFDLVDDAQKLIPTLQQSFHRDAYATATLGLYNLKRNRPEKGIELYEEAIKISGRNRDLKHKIKQRMNLELAKYYELVDPKQALWYLEKARKITDGHEYVRRDVLLLRTKLSELKPLPLLT